MKVKTAKVTFFHAGGHNMTKKVLLVMYRKMLSDALISQTGGDAFFKFTAEQNYASAALTAAACAPEIAVVEVPESGPWKSASKCLAICDVIRKQLPLCKVVVLCSENDADSCSAAIHAKQENRIDDFLYYDSSINYLFSKLEALI
jgi:hypothetical protein